MTCLLAAEHLTKTFPGAAAPVLSDMSFCVNESELFVLLGASGCGKTTTLRVIGGFERPDTGWVSLEGRAVEGPGVHVPPEKRGLGFVFQDYALFPHLDVMGNVAFGLRHLPRARRRAVATEVLWMVGLAGLERRRPQELSGGQQQRVALARAIAPWPRVLLLDEPFSNLDAELRESTRREIRDVVGRTGMSAVLVTHDQEEALSIADRLAVVRDGRIEQTGTPEEVYHRPRTAFVAGFLGRTNLLTGRAEGRTAATPLGPVSLLEPARGTVTLSLRPEHLRLRAAGTPGPGPTGRVLARQFKGHDMTYRIRVGDHTFTVQADYRAAATVGQSVRIEPVEPAAVVEPDPAPPTPAPAGESGT